MASTSKNSSRPNRAVTKNVFLDTSVHVSAKFRYDTGNLRRLAELAEGGLVAVFDTPVDEGEIMSNIRAIAEHIAKALKTFQREGAALRDTQLPALQPLFQELTKQAATDHLLHGYGDYRRRLSARRLQLPPDSLDDVMRQYFEGQAPFGDGDKKSEFPDAFIIAALTRWCLSKDEMMYVVTQDKGMAAAAAYSSVLFPLARLDDFLNLIVAEEHQAVAILAHRWMAHNRNSLLQHVSEAFTTGGFYVEDADGDVEDVAINEMKVSEPLLVEIAEGAAVFSSRAHIVFEADITYDNPSTGTYDSEDKVMVFMDRAHVRIRREDEFPAEIRVEFLPLEDVSTAVDMLEDAAITSVSLKEGGDIRVSIDDEVIEVYPDTDSETDWYASLVPEDDTEDGAEADDDNDHAT
jgi:hypothetical protein